MNVPLDLTSQVWQRWSLWIRADKPSFQLKWLYAWHKREWEIQFTLESMNDQSTRIACFYWNQERKKKKKDKYRPTPEISLQFCITCCLSTECRTKPGEIWIHMCICVIFPNSSFSWPVILSPCLVFQYFYDDWFYFILLWLYMPSKPHFLRK